MISQKAPYLQLNEQNEQVSNKFGLGLICPNIVTDDSHIIQTHTTTMDMYVSISKCIQKCAYVQICIRFTLNIKRTLFRQLLIETSIFQDEVLMAQDAAHAMRARIQASPATALRAPESLLTPPASSHKPDEYLGDEGDETGARSGISSTTTCCNTAASNKGGKSSSNNSVTSCSSRSNP